MEENVTSERDRPSSNVSNGTTKKVDDGLTTEITNSIARDMPNVMPIHTTNEITGVKSREVTNKIPSKITNGITNDIDNVATNNMSDQVIKDVANGVTNKITNGVTNKITNGVTNKITNGVTNKITNGVINKSTQAVTNKTANGVTNKIINAGISGTTIDTTNGTSNLSFNHTTSGVANGMTTANGTNNSEIHQTIEERAFVNIVATIDITNDGDHKSNNNETINSTVNGTTRRMVVASGNVAAQSARAETHDQVSDAEIERLARDEFKKAKEELVRSRRDKLILNLNRAASRSKFLNIASKCLNLPHNKSMEDAANALNAIPNCLENPINMQNVQPMHPNGRSWIRIQTNMKFPSSYSHSFHIPYLGESDAHLRSSNTLANDLQQQDKPDAGDDSDIEKEGSDDDMYDSDETPWVTIRPPNETRNMSARRKQKRLRTRHHDAVLNRAARRVALKKVIEELDITDARTIAGPVANAFDLFRRSYIDAYNKNVNFRMKAIAEQEQDLKSRKEGRDMVYKQITGSPVDTPAGVMESESVNVFFCRLCYTSLCTLHPQTIERVRPAVAPTDTSRKDFMTKEGASELISRCQSRAANSCWYQADVNLNAGTWWMSLVENESAWKDIRPVVEELFEGYGRDPCRISTLLGIILPSYQTIVQFNCARVGHMLEKLHPKTPGEVEHGRRRLGGPKRKKNKWKMHRPPSEQRAGTPGRRLDYVPCRHEGPCTLKNCTCKQKGVLCEKFCGCFTPSLNDLKSQVFCPNMHRGCLCKGSCQAKSCMCFAMDRECDPDFCKTCHEGCGTDHENISCRNNGLRMKRRQKLVAGRSVIHGWGVFATEDISKNDIIGEYVGEVISDDEAERRGRVYDEVTYSFLFTTTEDYALDSTHIGNKLRYINHSMNPNCHPKVMRVGGEVRVGLYAKRDIAKHEELFFNYGYNENGPEWAMAGKPKQSKKKTSSGKRKISSDTESNDTPWDGEHENVKSSGVPAVTTRARNRSKATPSPGSSDVDDGEASTLKRANRRRSKGSKRQKRRMSTGNQIPSPSPESNDDGRSKGEAATTRVPVWRSVLRRVSTGAADVESPTQDRKTTHTNRRSETDKASKEIEQAMQFHKKEGDSNKVSNEAQIIGEKANRTQVIPFSLEEKKRSDKKDNGPSMKPHSDGKEFINKRKKAHALPETPSTTIRLSSENHGRHADMSQSEFTNSFSTAKPVPHSHFSRDVKKDRQVEGPEDNSAKSALEKEKMRDWWNKTEMKGDDVRQELEESMEDGKILERHPSSIRKRGRESQAYNQVAPDCRKKPRQALTSSFTSGSSSGPCSVARLNASFSPSQDVVASSSAVKLANPKRRIRRTGPAMRRGGKVSPSSSKWTYAARRRTTSLASAHSLHGNQGVQIGQVGNDSISPVTKHVGMGETRTAHSTPGSAVREMLKRERGAIMTGSGDRKGSEDRKGNGGRNGSGERRVSADKMGNRDRKEGGDRKQSGDRKGDEVVFVPKKSQSVTPVVDLTIDD